MAIAIKTSEKAARQDTYRVAPQDVTPGRNSRIIPAPNYKQVVERLAVSIVKHGQLQPSEVRRLDDNSLVCVDGHTRHDAVKLIREGFEAIDPDSGETVRFHDPARLLWVKVTDLSEDDAFLHSIKANADREDTTDLQEALAQAELRTTLGWTDSKIARFYGYTNQNRVADLAKLTCTAEAVKTAVHEKRLALANAVLFIKHGLSEDEQVAFLDAAKDDSGKVNGPKLKKLLREKFEGVEDGDEDEGGYEPVSPVDPKTPPALDPSSEGDESPIDETVPKPVKKFVPRTAKDFQRWFAENTTDESKLNDGAAELFNVLSLWFKGQRNDDYLRVKALEYCVNKV